MRRILCLLISASLFVLPVKAEYYIVLSDDERVLAAENEHEQRSIASISKIMTAIVCLEQGDFNDIWTLGDEVLSVDEKRIYLQPGQMVSMRSLLYGLMLESGNDAAVALAKRVGGSIENFVVLMNRTAAEIGMLNTVFHNPHGLDIHGTGNLSTCFDMALLMNYAVKNEMFCEIIHTQQYQSEWGSVFHNSNRLLKEFPFTIGGKTGYTSKAGRTLVTAAQHQMLTLICVTFDYQDHFNFHKQNYITLFNTMKRQELLSEGKYRFFDYIVDVNVPMTVTCTDEELMHSQIRYWLDEDEKKIRFQFTLNDYVVIQSYSIEKAHSVCFWRWCI